MKCIALVCVFATALAFVAVLPATAQNPWKDYTATVDGHAYHFHMMPSGMGQVFKDEDKTVIGTVLPTGQIVPAVFGESVPDMTKAYGLALNGGGAASATTTPLPQQNSPAGGGDDVSASAAMEKGVPVVRFHNDAHFSNNIVNFFGDDKDSITLKHVAGKVGGEEAVVVDATMHYEMGGPNTGAGGKAVRGLLHVVEAAGTNGKGANLTQLGWYVHDAKGHTGNTATAGDPTFGRATAANPYGLEGQVLTALDVVHKQLDPNYTFPGIPQLRERAGLAPRAGSATVSK